MIWGSRNKYDANDPIQVALMGQLAEAAVLELTIDGLDDASSQVSLFLMTQGWSRKETKQRIDHALTTAAEHLRPEILQRAKLVGERAIKKTFD